MTAIHIREVVSAAAVFHPATRYSLQQLAAFFTAAYEGYAYPVGTSAELLARRVREESLDLAVSAVMELGGFPAGLFLIGRRGDGAWCGGFGLNKPQRRRGYAAALAAGMLARTRAAGATWLQLEVLAGNAAARAVYAKAGFVAGRDLLILAWRAAPVEIARPAPGLRRTSLADHLDHLGRLPPSGVAVPCWQRSLASLGVRADLEAWSAAEGEAGVLLSRMPDGTARLVSFFAVETTALARVLTGVQAMFPRLLVINEPPDSPYLAALRATGFAEIDRQSEMRLEFLPDTSPSPEAR